MDPFWTPGVQGGSSGEIFFVDCAESLVWGRELSGGAMLHRALGQGLCMVRQGLAWASSGGGPLSEDFGLRGRILKSVFSSAWLVVVV